MTSLPDLIIAARCPRYQAKRKPLTRTRIIEMAFEDKELTKVLLAAKKRLARCQ